MTALILAAVACVLLLALAGVLAADAYTVLTQDGERRG